MADFEGRKYRARLELVPKAYCQPCDWERSLISTLDVRNFQMSPPSTFGGDETPRIMLTILECL